MAARPSARAHGTAILVAVVLVATGAAAVTGGVSAHGGTLFVAGSASDAEQLLGALQSRDVIEVVLTAPYSVAEAARHLPDGVLPQISINSNLTLRGLPGRFTELDFAYVRGAVSLCAGCTLRLVQLTLTNGQRLVSLSFFKGRPRSRVVVEDCFVTQLVCAPWDVAFDGVRDAPRSTAFPAAAANGSQARSQDVSLVQSTFRGRVYDHAIYARDVAVDVPAELMDSTVMDGGYSVSYRNTTRLCLHEADPACVSAHSLQHCIDEKMRVLSSGGAGGTLNALAAQQPKQQQSDLSNGALAGLTIGVAIGALLLAALSMFVLQRHRARRVSREPCLAKWSQGSFDASSIDPWLLSKGGGTLDGGTSGTAGGLPSSADWGAAGGLGGTGAGHSAPPAALRSGAGGHVSTPDAAARAGQRGTRLAVAISSKVRRIHQARLLTAIAAGRHDGSAGSGMSAATSAGAMKRIASAPSLLSDDDGAGCVSSGSGSRRMQPGSNDGLQLKEVLGRGGFGVCYRALWHGATVAVKVMHLPAGSCAAASTNTRRRSALEAMAVQEAAISSTIAHPNTVKVFSVAIKPLCPGNQYALAASAAASERGSPGSVQRGAAGAAPSTSSLHVPAGDTGATTLSGVTDGEPDLDMVPCVLQLIMEFCDQGTLRDALDKGLLHDEAAGTNSLPLVLCLARQIARACGYLHQENILHADLKSSNVLLQSAPPPPGALAAAAAGDAAAAGSGAVQQQQQPVQQQQQLLRRGWIVAKVSDFGLSTYLDPSHTHVTQAGAGTLTHTAPEVLVHGHCSRASDVYAFAMTLWELATGERLFTDVPRALLGHAIVEQQLRPRWPAALLECPAWAGVIALTERCWASSAPDRPSFGEVLAELDELAEEVDADAAAAAICTQ